MGKLSDRYLRGYYVATYSEIPNKQIGYLFIDLLRNYYNFNSIKINDNLLILSFVLIVIILILRTLKHNTSLLNEKDRS